MQAKGGIACLVTAFWLVMALTPATGWAADSGGGFLPVLSIADQTSLEAQMLGEKPLRSSPQLHPLLPQTVPSVQLHQNGGDASLNLPRNVELNISIRYNRDPAVIEPQRLNDSPLYMKYSMDYRVLSNLKVGLNGYLYRPAEEGFFFQRPLGNRLMGFGPQLKYDLGKWSFLLKSQVETGNLNRSENVQNWFRVWYAF
jgi:hypothetical protein